VTSKQVYQLLLDKIDLAIYHIEKSNIDYNHHIDTLLKTKKDIKKILNTDFDKLARNKKIKKTQ
jgi:hypothetical protein